MMIYCKLCYWFIDVFGWYIYFLDEIIILLFSIYIAFYTFRIFGNWVRGIVIIFYVDFVIRVSRGFFYYR